MVAIIQVKEWMRKGLVSIGQSEDIVSCARTMHKKSVGSLIVVDKSRPIGIITHTDIINRVVAKGLDLSKTKVSDVMSRGLVTSEADTTFSHLSRVMRRHGIKHIAITEKGKLIGMVTSTDIVKLMSGKK